VPKNLYKYLKRGINMREEILSVGIDIGTSTTQLVFSKIIIENLASNFSIPRISIVDKQIIYRSEIYFTPLKSQREIDGEKIRELVEGEYHKAGIAPLDVKTGAVIITGETARKQNANDVLQKLSGLAGEFVVATAGPDLEGIISARGAGADKISEEEDSTVINLDVGGGTTNIAVFKEGKLLDTGCLDIGGRLIRIDEFSGKVLYIAEKIKEIIKLKHVSIAIL
jgi:ethanolamine utilization protein EutA